MRNSKILLISLLFILFSCSKDKTVIPITTTKIWNFTDLIGWEDGSQNTNSNINYTIESGNLKIVTNANTWERPKVKTTATFGAGTYTWRVYVPEMGVGDQCSIGAFLYSDDTHELDFEIGYGNQATRNQLVATTDELIVYMTSQANPFVSTPKKIKRAQWYNFSIEMLKTPTGNYQANWKINSVLEQTNVLTYGTETTFHIFCSVENLLFIGDHIPANQNYALFDFVEFKQN